MHNYYLETLELQPGASKEDIKKAYRRLSKKYHPDVNKEESANEKFLAIAEAYNFLKETGPRPHQETITYDYDPMAEEFNARREKARKKAYEHAQREATLKRKINKSIVSVFDWLLLPVIVFNLTLLADQIMPPDKFNISTNEFRQAMRLARVENDRPSVSLHYKGMKMGLGDGAGTVAKSDCGVIISFTKVLKVPVEAEFCRNGNRYIMGQQFSILKNFFFLMPVIIITYTFFAMLVKNPDDRSSLGFMVLISFLIQMYIYSIF